MKVASYVVVTLIAGTAFTGLHLPGAVQVPSAQGRCPTDLPPAGIDPLNPADRGRVLEYAGRLRYHPATPPTGESRELTVLLQSPYTPPDSLPPRPYRTFGLGPRADVRPETCSHMNSPADLGPGRGRIVARMELSAEYPKLALPKGVSYLWVDSLDTERKWARGIIVPEDREQRARRFPVRYEPHPDYDRSFAEARWLFSARDDHLWESCVRFGCCYLEHGQPGDTTHQD